MFVRKMDVELGNKWIETEEKDCERVKKIYFHKMMKQCFLDLRRINSRSDEVKSLQEIKGPKNQDYIFDMLRVPLQSFL